MDPAAALTLLTTRLRALHKALVEVSRQKYEAEWGAVDGAQLLQLLTRHPDFQWLHELSEFMVDVDTMRDRDDLTALDVRGAYLQARKILWPSEHETSAFADRYRSLLQNAPALVVEHAALKMLLESREQS